MTGEPRLADIGEFGLIDRVSALVGQPDAVIGIGDDTAVLDTGGPEYTLATVDMRVEGVHFTADADRRSAGRWAMVSNISDIAAMGGSPAYALISLAVNPEIAIREIEQLYAGLIEEARRFGVCVVGGNVTRTSGPLCVDVTLLGHVPRNEVVLRRGAVPGDVLLVSGSLGGQAAARLSGRTVDPPTPQVHLGRRLAAARLVHAMIDLSDGLGSDVHHLAVCSGVGARLTEGMLPLGPGVAEIARELGMRPRDLALFGGEDYELLMAVAPQYVGAAMAASHPEALTAVGSIVAAEEGVSLETADGRREALLPGGWRHF
jgi:thiamine-monophosphate kinase